MTETEPKPAETTPVETTAESAPEAPEAAPAAPRQPSQAGLWVGVAVAALVAGAAAGGYATWPQWRHLVDPAAPQNTDSPAVAGEVEMLRADLAATRERLRALEARLHAAPAGAGPDLAPMDTRLTQAERQIQALAAQPQVPARLAENVDGLVKDVAELKRSSADAAAVLRLADRVEKVEAEMRDLQARRSSAVALLLAVGQLREAVGAAMPFDDEMRAVRALAPQDPEMAGALDAIKARAPAGIPTFATLRARFEALAPAIVRAQALPGGDSWWRQTLERMASLVTIRREDGAAAGDSAAARVARAEARLAEGDLAGAVAEIAALADGPAAEAAPWLADARARLDADRALSVLTAHVVAQVGAKQ